MRTKLKKKDKKTKNIIFRVTEKEVNFINEKKKKYNLTYKE